MSHTKQKTLLFAMLLSAVAAQYGSAPLPAQLPPSHRPPPPLFSVQAPKKQHKQVQQSVPIFKPSLGLGPLPVPSGLGPLPLPVPSGLGPLPLPAGQVSMSMPSAASSYSYGSPNGSPSSFQQLPQPSFQPQRPWQPAPSFSSVPAQQMNFAQLAGQQGVPQSYGLPSMYQQQASFESVPSKFLSPPPPPSFSAPVSYGASNPVMQPSFPIGQPTQFAPSMPSYGNGPYMVQMQQNPESFSFGAVPQRELAPQFNGPSPQSYYPSQFGQSGSSPSYGTVETQQFQMPSMSSQSFGSVSSQQSFAIPAPQQSFAIPAPQQSFAIPAPQQPFALPAPQQSFSPSESSQSYSPAQSYHATQMLGPAESQQSFAPAESQQMFNPSSSSQSFAIALPAQSYGQSNAGPQMEGPSDMQSNVQIFGIPPPSQQQGEYQQSNFQMNSAPVRQESTPENLLPILHQSAVAMASSHYQPGPEPAGPSSGSPYDGGIFTRYVRVSDTFPSA